MPKVVYELCPKCNKMGLHKISKRRISDNTPFDKKECRYCYYRLFTEILPTK